MMLMKEPCCYRCTCLDEEAVLREAQLCPMYISFACDLNVTSKLDCTYLLRCRLGLRLDAQENNQVQVRLKGPQAVLRAVSPVDSNLQWKGCSANAQTSVSGVQ